MSLLEEIKEPNDIKKIPEEKLPFLAVEIRRFLLQTISENGGHLASNLGTVELTMALHLYLDFPKDVLIWDVGHQAYTHKLLTGRKEEFASLRKFEGMSGFPKKKESACDRFETGHSSTSISAALGFVHARELNQGHEKVIAVIGDGALSGGMALEAINNAADLKTNMIIVLNDNEWSISQNVGGMANYLGKIRTNLKYVCFKNKIEGVIRGIPKIGNLVADKLKLSKDSLKRLLVPGMLFEDMGLTYIGPIDGHDISQVKMALESAGRVNGAVMIHAITKKGKGYKKAEKHPAKFHGVNPFSIKSGEEETKEPGRTYTDVFSETMLELAKKEPGLIGITAAMPYGTGLYDMKKRYPDRFFDVGIAEEHAVTFAAGLAAAGMKPVVAIYSTFLQRAYDQILHDVCLQSLPVIFAIDRAGIVGRDGETHQGIYDVAFLSSIPSLTIMSPKDEWEMKEMLHLAIQARGPVAIRYPKGLVCETLSKYQTPVKWNENEVMERGRDVVLLSTGSMVAVALEAASLLKEENITPTLINLRFLQEVNKEMIRSLEKDHDIFVTLEDCIYTGSYGQRAASVLLDRKKGKWKQLSITLPNGYVEHGSVEELRKKYGLDAVSVAKKIKEMREEKSETKA